MGRAIPSARARLRFPGVSIVTSPGSISISISILLQQLMRRAGACAGGGAAGMEEFVTEDEEPWYDQRNLEQGMESAIKYFLGYYFVIGRARQGWFYCGDERILLSQK